MKALFNRFTNYIASLPYSGRAGWVLNQIVTTAATTAAYWALPIRPNSQLIIVYNNITQIIIVMQSLFHGFLGIFFYV